MLLVGDSVAMTMGFGLERAQAADHLVVWNRAYLGCGVVRGVVWVAGRVTSNSPVCEQWPQRWKKQVDELHPDVVLILLGAWDLFDRRIAGKWLRVGTPEYDPYFLSELKTAVDILGSDGARVVLLTSPYYQASEEVTEQGRHRSAFEPERVDRMNADYRELERREPDRVKVLELNRFVSPDGVFTNHLAGVDDLRGDGVHFTPAGTNPVASWLAPQLRDVAAGNLVPPIG